MTSTANIVFVVDLTSISAVKLNSISLNLSLEIVILAKPLRGDGKILLLPECLTLRLRYNIAHAIFKRTRSVCCQGGLKYLLSASMEI